MVNADRSVRPVRSISERVPFACRRRRKHLYVRDPVFVVHVQQRSCTRSDSNTSSNTVSPQAYNTRITTAASVRQYPRRGNTVIRRIAQWLPESWLSWTRSPVSIGVTVTLYNAGERRVGLDPAHRNRERNLRDDERRLSFHRLPYLTADPTTPHNHVSDVPRAVRGRHRSFRVLGERARASKGPARPLVQPHVATDQPDHRRAQGPPGAAPSKSSYASSRT